MQGLNALAGILDRPLFAAEIWSFDKGAKNRAPGKDYLVSFCSLAFTLDYNKRYRKDKWDLV
jgi:hypothetical protein